jgi:hypothetical protein
MAEIVKLIEQLQNVEIDLEADSFVFDDVDTDLPGVGKQLGYFLVTVERPALAGNRPEVNLTLRLATDGCWIEATNPDPETRGVIADIQKFTAPRRRISRWLRRPMGPRSRNWSERLLAPLGCGLLIFLGGLMLALIGTVIYLGVTGRSKTNVNAFLALGIPGIVGGVIA